MNDTKTRTSALPKNLRPERLTTMPLSCRFGWHQWYWGEISPGRIWQDKICMKCGRSKEVMR